MLTQVDFPDPKGPREHDETSFVPSQRHWGPDLMNRPALTTMFDHPDWTSRDMRSRQRPDWLKYDGVVVLDQYNQPIYDWPNLPLTLSSAIEGWKIESLFRLLFSQYRCFQQQDLCARMPHTGTSQANGAEKKRRDRITNRISMRMGRFREEAGLISWISHKADGKDDVIRRIRVEQGMRNNSTRDLPDFNPLDIERIKRPGRNKHLQNARKNITKEQRDKQEEKEKARLEKIKMSMRHQGSDERPSAVQRERPTPSGPLLATDYLANSSLSHTHNGSSTETATASGISAENPAVPHQAIEQTMNKSRKRKNAIDHDTAVRSHEKNQSAYPPSKKPRTGNTEGPEWVSNGGPSLNPSRADERDGHYTSAPIVQPAGPPVREQGEYAHEEQQLGSLLQNEISRIEGGNMPLYDTTTGQSQAFLDDFSPSAAQYGPPLFQQPPDGEQPLSTLDPGFLQDPTNEQVPMAPTEQIHNGGFLGETDIDDFGSIQPTVDHTADAGNAQPAVTLPPYLPQYQDVQPQPSQPLEHPPLESPSHDDGPTPFVNPFDFSDDDYLHDIGNLNGGNPW